MPSITSRPRARNGQDPLQDALTLHRRNRLEEAKAAYRDLLAREPRHAEATALLGVALVQSGSAEEGILALGRALELQPRNATFLYNLGVAYEKADRLEEADAAHARALDADPRLRSAWSARSGVLRRLGRWEEAAGCARRAVELAPEDADAWNDLGVCLERAGDLAGAGRAFRDALLRDGHHPLASTNLAAVLPRLRSFDPDLVSGTLDVLWRNVQADPEDPIRWSTFTETFKSVGASDAKTAAELLPVLLACLRSPSVDHRRLSRVGLSIVRAHARTSPLLEAADHGDASLDVLFERDASWAALADPAIGLLLERSIVPDQGWERLFTRARRHLAVRWAARAETEPLPEGMEDAALAIARQCFHNGYVWSWDDAEAAAVEALVPTMAGRELGTRAGDRLKVAILASYVPLVQWERAADVLEWSGTGEDAPLTAMVRQQITEPVQEEGLKELIPSFGEMATQVSRDVRAMYEEHPYPRWLSLGAHAPMTPAQALRRQCPWARTDALATVDRPRVLVAGCGTGHHLLTVASRFRGVQATGVDLSRSSLAYAVRKAGELGFTDVSVVHADILALGAWSEPFHIIECAGVLHHMEDPMAGWSVLTGLLAPGGFMKVGLYSELARRPVVEARAYIAAQGWPATAESIRKARPLIARHFADDDDSSPARWRDFFNMHECRDLLFHVQEHRFTLPQIEEALETLGLEFVGWDGLPGKVAEAFRTRFPEPADQRDLGAWHDFETENPSTFASMYQFWVSKPVASPAGRGPST